MKKILIYFSLILICFSAFTSKVKAEGEEYDKEFEFDVVFTKEGKIESTFTEEDASLFDDIQPGDNLKVTFNLKNEYKKAIDWYMLNISDAFDKGENAGYEYILSYSIPVGDENEIYNSSVVGGDDSDGLAEATENLDQYFLLQEGFGKGEEQTVTLVMTVDGETSRKDYQTAAAKIRFQFAVEVPPDADPSHKERYIYIPYTGDEINLTFYIVSEILALILLLAVLVAYYCYRRKQREA